MQGKTLLRVTIMLVCVVGTSLGLNNTYGDNSASLALAEKTACGQAGCTYTLLRESRSAISHEYSFQTRLVERGKAAPGSSADVVCKRELLLLGDFHCALKSSPGS